MDPFLGATLIAEESKLRGPAGRPRGVTTPDDHAVVAKATEIPLLLLFPSLDVATLCSALPIIL